MTQTTIETSTSGQQLRNPILLAALQLAFPTIWESVKVHSPGQRRVNNGFVGSNGPPDEFGEEYQLDCPFCGDSRGRMRINYSYDPTVHLGRWHCFNENCHKKPEHRNELARRLQAVWSHAKQTARNRSCTAPCAPPTTRSAPEAPIEVTLPELTIPINQLPENHPALTYLRGRNFDPNQLWQDFRVGYCEGSRSSAPAIVARIVVPVCEPPARPGDSPKLVGWQARQIPGFTQDQFQDAKYLTMAGFRKSQRLYSAIQGPIGSDLFIVEGVTDVWRIGPSAIALLGKKASPTQLDLLVQIGQFKTGIFVALDSDAETEKQDLVQDLKLRFELIGVGTQVYSLLIPKPYKDVGECSITELACAKTVATALAAIANVTAQPASCPSTNVSVELPPQRTVPPNELAARLIENATGTLPTPSADHSEQLQSLGMLSLFNELEIPLQTVLRSVEHNGLLVSDERLRTIVCNHSPLAAEAARLRRAICRRTRRIYTRLDSLGSCTGMITSRDYALQNMKRCLRPCVVAGENCKLIYADEGQFQWRLAAALSGDPLLLQLFSQPGFDLYRAVAITVFGPENLQAQRSIVKDSMMEFLFSCNRLEQLSPVGHFLATQHPHLLQWLQALEHSAMQQRIVRTPFGRMVRLPTGDDGNEAVRKVVNYLIQATAADVFKYACLAVHRAVSQYARILLPLHDALLLECPDSHVDAVRAQVVQAMEMPVAGIPVRLEVKTTILEHWE